MSSPSLPPKEDARANSLVMVTLRQSTSCGMFHFAIAQGHLQRGTINPVTFAETEAIPDFDGRAYSLEEIALML